MNEAHVIMVKLKRESDYTDGSSSSGSNKKPRGQAPAAVNGVVSDHLSRRGLRSRYLAVKNMINDVGDEIGKHDSGTFDFVFGEMESLQKLVTKPREQVADAKALLDITKSLVLCVKDHASGGLTPSEFVSHILREFGGQGGLSTSTQDSASNSVAWNDIGLSVSHAFKGCPGCCTMIGPMEAEIKQRKAINRRPRKHASAQLVRPEELGGPREEKLDTDKNMHTMFDILRRKRDVRLENLVLNRNSFAQTVENLFTLSFLVKDGRAEIKVNEAGLQLVSPRNAVRAGVVAFSHFVFRFDFDDWKLMIDTVGTGEELMPHRSSQ